MRAVHWYVVLVIYDSWKKTVSEYDFQKMNGYLNVWCILNTHYNINLTDTGELNTK